MVDEPALFDAAPYREQPADLAPPASPDRRRTQLQAQRLAAGLHPLSGVVGTPLKLHPQAPPAEDRRAAGPRCGSCWYRQVLPHHNRSYPKCLHPGSLGADTADEYGPPRVSHSAASDCRAFWPACVDYSPGDTAISPDAARFIPEAPWTSAVAA